MLQLTKRTEYGLIAMIHMADRGGRISSAREIAEHYPVPKRLLAEVLKDLARGGMIESHRGASGGYTLARPAEDITLGDVIGALEGRPSLTSCAQMPLFHGGHGGSCDVEPVCPIRSPIQRIRLGLWAMLERTTLRDMSHHDTALPASAAAPAVLSGSPRAFER